MRAWQKQMRQAAEYLFEARRAFHSPKWSEGEDGEKIASRLVGARAIERAVKHLDDARVRCTRAFSVTDQPVWAHAPVGAEEERAVRVRLRRAARSLSVWAGTGHRATNTKRADLLRAVDGALNLMEQADDDVDRIVRSLLARAEPDVDEEEVA